MRDFRRLMSGFAAAPLATACVIATIDGVRFHRGGEFASAAQSVLFDLFLWGVLFLSLSGALFAASVAWTVPAGLAVPVPRTIGVLAGMAAVAVAGVGIPNRLTRLYDVPAFAAIAIPGLLAGIAVLVVVVLLRRH